MLLERELKSSGSADSDRRARILDAMVEVCGERGFTGASVALVSARAKVSSRTFYKVFDGLEDCFVAVLDMGLERTSRLIVEAFEREDCWRDGVRAALASLLVLFDSEPVLARVWLVEAVAAGAWALERREQNVVVLRTLILSWWGDSDCRQRAPMAAEGAMASVLGVIQAHVVSREPAPLVELLGPLMGLVALPYLNPAGVQEEVRRGADLARELLAGESWLARSRPAPTRERGIPTALSAPAAHRARLCLRFIAAHPEVSNRQIADGIGVVHHGQISTLLSRLAGHGLLIKRLGPPGHPNAWSLTSEGQHVALALAAERWAAAFAADADATTMPWPSMPSANREVETTTFLGCDILTDRVRGS